MKNLRYLIVLFVLLTSFSATRMFSQDTSPLIRFGLIADIQYGDCDTHGDRYYRNSLEKLTSCIDSLNEEKVQFTINLGDIVDRSPADIDPVVDLLKKLDAPVFHTTGNHDYKGFTNNGDLFNKLDMPAEYYSFKKGDWLFIMLNTNEIASYSNIKGTWKEAELPVMQDRIKSSKRNNDQDWNGGISSKQLQWLKDQLQEAQKNGMKVLVLSHNPIYPATEFTALNDQEILDTIADFSCVKCVISGHHHTGAFAYYKNIPCITTEGMIETESKNAFGVVDIYENGLVLTGYGRTKSYTIPLK